MSENLKICKKLIVLCPNFNNFFRTFFVRLLD